MEVAIYGHTDKRPFTYSLLSVIQINGPILVITDNTNYKRLIGDGSDFGQFGDISIFVTQDSPTIARDSIMNNKNVNHAYANIIYDYVDQEVVDADKHIHIIGSTMTHDEEDFYDNLPEGTELIKIMYDMKPDKRAKHNIQVSDRTLYNLELMERYRMYRILDDKGMVKALVPLVQDIFNLNEGTRQVEKYIKSLLKEKGDKGK